MISAGIDVGAQTIKIMVTKDKVVIDKVIVSAGQDAKLAINNAWEQITVDEKKINCIIATGSGRNNIKRSTGYVTEVSAAAKGAKSLYPKAKCVIDVGAEEGRAIRLDEKGKVADFAINEKCAAGAGAFTEAMARALEVSLKELGEMSLKSKGTVAMNAQCAVFAESELVTLVHSNTPREDIAKAIHDAISDRIVSMVRRVGSAEPIILIGGVAKNKGFIHSLNTDLKTKVIVPDDPEMITAYGAALLGEEGNFADNSKS